MQTFLPSTSYFKSAQSLDNRRLNKQITETWQILQALHDPGYGWQNHPAVKMWCGYESSLIAYGVACYMDWRWRYIIGIRGGKIHHKSGEALLVEFCKLGDVGKKPYWLVEKFCSNHRSILLGKDKGFYSKWGWVEEAAEMVNGSWPYLWPK